MTASTNPAVSSRPTVVRTARTDPAKGCARGSVAGVGALMSDPLVSRRPVRRLHLRHRLGPRGLERWAVVGRARRSDQPPVAGSARELVAVGQLQLAQHRGDVGLHGLDRDEQLAAYLPVGVAAGDQPQHLPLSWRQGVQLGVHGHPDRRRRPGEGVQHEPREPRREDGVPIGYPPDRGRQVGAADGLGDVAARARADDTDHVLGGVGHAEGEKPDVGTARCHRGQHRLTATAGQVDVEQDDVGPAGLDHRHGRLHVGGLPDDLHAVAEFGPHARAEEPVVVDQHNPGPGRCHRALPVGCSGRLSSISVPLPGELWITAVPPWRSIRPTTDSRMPARSAATASSAPPRRADGLPDAPPRPLVSRSADLPGGCAVRAAHRAALAAGGQSGAVGGADGAASREVGGPANGLGGASGSPSARLGGALEAVAADVEEQYGTPIEVVLVGDCPLDERLTSAVQAAREAMVNAVKHSVADSIAVYAEAELVQATRPDVVLLDVHLPGGGGQAVLAAVAASCPDVRFLALSVSDAAEDVISVIRAGARGYVTKTISGPDLAAAIRRVADGDAVFSGRLAGFVLDAFAGAATPVGMTVDPELDALTPREREVLRLIARGYTYREIGRQLFISVKTVETHVSAVLRKLQLSNRHQLTR